MRRTGTVQPVGQSNVNGPEYAAASGSDAAHIVVGLDEAIMVTGTETGRLVVSALGFVVAESPTEVADGSTEVVGAIAALVGSLTSTVTAASVVEG